MANSIRELIMQDIKTTLDGVTTGNGYDNTLQTVERFNASQQSRVNSPWAHIVPEDEEKQDGRVGYYECFFRVAVVLGMHEDETGTVKDTKLLSLLADVEKALMADPHRNNLADDTRLTGNEFFEVTDDIPIIGVVLFLEVKYLHKRTDPFAGRS